MTSPKHVDTNRLCSTDAEIADTTRVLAEALDITWPRAAYAAEKVVAFRRSPPRSSSDVTEEEVRRWTLDGSYLHTGPFDEDDLGAALLRCAEHRLYVLVKLDPKYGWEAFARWPDGRAATFSRSDLTKVTRQVAAWAYDTALGGDAAARMIERAQS